MRKFALVGVFLLFGCTSTPATNNAVTEANNALNSIKENLPPECRTEEVEKHFADVSKKVEQIKASCEIDVRSVKNTNSALWSVIALLLVAILFLAKK